MENQLIPCYALRKQSQSHQCYRNWNSIHPENNEIMQITSDEM